jgi:hemoglobin-like flavoprotein
MGNGITTWKLNKWNKKTVIKYPLYYILTDNMTEDDIIAARTSWELIITATPTASFLKMKEHPGFTHASSLAWFYDVFYEKFFEISPESKPFFANSSMLAQGRLVATLVSSCIASLKHGERLRKDLTKMTQRHNAKGIPPESYGKMGDALFCALETVLGSMFDFRTRLAWIKTYSLMLGIILPIAYKYENLEGATTSNNSRFSSNSECSTHSIGSIKSETCKLLNFSDTRSQKGAGAGTTACPYAFRSLKSKTIVFPESQEIPACCFADTPPQESHRMELSIKRKCPF